MDGYISGAPSINRAADTAMDAELLEGIYRRYYKNVYNYICFRINNHHDAEELASAVFESAVRKFGAYNPDVAPIEAWLIGIARNAVTDYLRRAGRRRFAPLEEIAGLASSLARPDEVLVKNEEHAALIRAMSRLNDRERQVLALRFATDMKNREIARLLGISESNTGIIIHRSVKKLKRILEREAT